MGFLCVCKGYKYVTQFHASPKWTLLGKYRGRGEDFAWGLICMGIFVFQSRAQFPTLVWVAHAKFTTHLVGVTVLYDTFLNLHPLPIPRPDVALE